MKKSTLLWYFTALFCAANLIIFLSDFISEATLEVLSNTFPVVCSLIALICLYSALRGFTSFDFTKKTWLLITLGSLCYFIAELVYAAMVLIFHIDMNETFPSIADLFWCLGYIPFIWGIINLLIGYIKSGLPIGNIKVYIMLGAIFAVAITAIFIFVFIPIIEDPETTGLAFFTSLYYPLADLMIVIPAAMLMYITSLFGKGSITTPWKLLGLSFIGFTIADLIYSYLVWQGLYGSGSYIDLLWNNGYLLFGLAGLYQRELVESLKKTA